MSVWGFWRHLHNIIIKIKYNLYRASGSVPSPPHNPQRKSLRAPLLCHIHFSPSPLLTVSGIHPVQTLAFHFFTTIFNIIFSSDTNTVCNHDFCKTRNSSIKTRKASLYSTQILWWCHPIQYIINALIPTCTNNETSNSLITVQGHRKRWTGFETAIT